MVRALLTLMILCLSVPAHAAARHKARAVPVRSVHAHHAPTHIVYVRYPHARRVHALRAGVARLDAPCRQAAALGGPCGCFASEFFFGHSVRDLWHVNGWLARFPRSSPAPGTAAIWPGRHVAPVVAANGGTVTVKDSWGTHAVSTRGLIFVAVAGRARLPGWPL